jgi:hypothetical protein
MHLRAILNALLFQSIACTSVSSACSEGIAGKRLAEGDAPAIFIVSQDGLQEYGKNWRKIRAAIYDSAGREYLSPKKTSKESAPSWARVTV